MSLFLSPSCHSSVSIPPQILITITEHQWPRHDGTKQSSSQEEMGHRVIPRHPRTLTSLKASSKSPTASFLFSSFILRFFFGTDMATGRRGRKVKDRKPMGG